MTGARYAREDEDVQDAQLDAGADFENEQDPLPPPPAPPPPPPGEELKRLLDLA